MAPPRFEDLPTAPSNGAPRPSSGVPRFEDLPSKSPKDAEIYAPPEQGWLEKVGAWLDPMFGETRGMGVTDNSYMDNGKFVEAPFEQEPGVKKVLANAIELGGTVAGGVLGGVAGSAAGGATGPAAPVAAPVGAYLGSALGAEAGNIAALAENQNLGLRPNIPEYDPVEQMRLKNLGPRLAVDLVLPPVLKVGSKVIGWAARGITQPFQNASGDLKGFLDRPHQLARGITDNPRAYKHIDLERRLSEVPEIFTGEREGLIPVPLDLPKKLIEVSGRTKAGIFEASKIDNFFDTINTNVGLLKRQVGGAIDEILGRVPAKVRLGDIDLSSVKKRAMESGTTSVEGKNIRNVWDSEAEYLVQKFAPEKAQQYSIALDTIEKYKKAAARQDALGTPISNSLETDYRFADGLVNKVNQKMADKELTPVELREMATHFGEQARFDMTNPAPDKFAASRMQVYRDFNTIFTKKKYEIVKDALPGELESFKKLNEKFGTLSDIEPFTKLRAQQANTGGGPGFRTGVAVRQENPAVLESTIGRIGTVLEPMRNQPKARILYGLGLRNATGAQAAQGVSDAVSITGQAVQRGALAVDQNIPMPWQTSAAVAKQPPLPAISGAGASAPGTALPAPQANGLFPQGVLPNPGKVAAVREGIPVVGAMMEPVKAQAEEPKLSALEAFNQPEFQEVISELPLDPMTQQKLFDARNATPMEKYAALGQAKIEARDMELFEPSQIQGIHSFIATPHENRIGVIPDSLERQVFGQMIDDSISSTIERAKLKAALNKDGSVLDIPEKYKYLAPKISAQAPKEPETTALVEEPVRTELSIRGVPSFTPESLITYNPVPQTASVSNGTDEFKRVIQDY